MDNAARLWARVRETQRGDRAADLARVEERRRLNDVAGLRIACEAWTSAYPIAVLDDPAGRAQAARILEICPDDRPGEWRSDPRGRLARFFLDGREADVRGDVLARSLEPLSGVPDAVAARVKLHAGRRDEAEELARRSGEPDTVDWSAYLVSLARDELRSGEIAGARAVLDRLGPVGRQACGSLLVRRDLARAGRDEAEAARVQELLNADRRTGRSAQASASAASLPLCLDPEAAAESVLGVQIEAGGPAVVVYGWDGGVAGVLAAPEGSSIVRISPGGRAGSRIFFVRTLAGGPVTAVRAALIPPAAPSDGVRADGRPETLGDIGVFASGRSQRDPDHPGSDGA